jgi:capsular exopolysaccharide synthesis family protein
MIFYHEGLQNSSPTASVPAMLEHTSRAETPQREHLFRREYVTRSDIAHLVRRNASTIAGSILVCLTAAALYVLLAQPMFTAHAQLLIDRKLSQALRETASDASYGSPEVESQIAVLRSEELALNVIKKQGLLADIEPQGGQLSGLRALIARIFGRKESAPESDAERSREAIARFEAGLDVHRVGISYAIDVYFSARDPQSAARIANSTVEAYLQNLLDTRAAASKVASQWLEERVGQLRAQMNSAARRLQEYKARRDYRIFKRSDQPTESAGHEPSWADGGATTLDELEATARTTHRIYESFYQAFTEAVQRESYPVSDARIISRATIPDRKSSPKTILILTLGALIGTLAGFGIALVRHSLDHFVRSPRQIRDEIGFECLAQIPEVGIGREPTLLRFKRGVASLIKRSVAPVAAEDHAFSAVIDTPFSPFSEGLKRLKTGLTLASRGRALRCIGITSISAHEGKTTIAVNLAAQMAMSGVRTLLIDADARNSTLSRQFAPSARQGVLDVLRGESDLPGVVVPVKKTGVGFLPIATKTDDAGRGDLLASEEMAALLQRASETYAAVIVDLPPLRMAAEAIAISALLDGVIILAEWEKTPMYMLMDAAQSLRNAQAHVVGAAITKVAVRAAEYYTKPPGPYLYRGN